MKLRVAKKILKNQSKGVYHAAQVSKATTVTTRYSKNAPQEGAAK